MIEEILGTIESSGITGIKKTELKKTFGKDCESILEELKAKEQIFIEKNVYAYFIWTKVKYIQKKTKKKQKYK